MRRILATAGLVMATFFFVDALGDMTQNRPDRPRPGSQSEIVLTVEGRGRQTPTQKAAESLWGACQGTVSEGLAPPGPVEVGPGRVRLVTEPALGDHAWRRLRGCLEDATVDLVRAKVVSKRDIPGPPTVPG